MGNAGSSEIVFQDEFGLNNPVSPEALSDLFSEFSSIVRCVLLNACFSDKQASAISKHIGCVIGMAGPVSDEAARNFSGAFYQALGYGKDVKSCYDLGCNQIQLAGLAEQNTPKIMSDSINPSEIVFTFEQGRDIVHEFHDPVQDNLPPKETIAIDFIGRQDELNILDKWFDDRESKLWVIAGFGGTGKTAIAYRFGINIKTKAPRGYEYILWLSAKRRRFIEGTIVYIDDPDFIDLESATEKIISAYGFESETLKSLETKKLFALELLNELPALVIVDDVDSLEGEAEDAIAFFTFDVPKTASKILFTSRRTLFGLTGVTTRIEGFIRGEALDFMRSRAKLLGMDFDKAVVPYIDRILRITDSSPLYMEELLRLCSIGIGTAEVIRVWEEKGGDVAREYALQREFDMLSEGAKKILLACCLNRSSSTTEDLMVITGLKKEMVYQSMESIGKLFLMPKPTVIKEVPRFDVNVNTRNLVKEVMHDTDIYQNLSTNVKRLAGELQMTGKRRFEISEYIRHSATLMKLNRFPEAEDILKKGLTKFPEDPDLLAHLGRTYARWVSENRLTDARTCFKRAAELKCQWEDMYHHWWSLECKQQEWTNAVEASEKGIKQFPTSWQLKYKAGYAHSRLGSKLRTQFQADRARYQLNRAQNLLENALVAISSVELDSIDTSLHWGIHRSLVLNSEAQGRIDLIAKYINMWLNYYRDDPEALHQKVRLIKRFVGLNKLLD